MLINFLGPLAVDSVAAGFAVVFAEVVAVDDFEDYLVVSPVVVVLFAMVRSEVPVAVGHLVTLSVAVHPVVLFVVAHLAAVHFVVRLAENDFAEACFDFVVLFLLPCAFAYFFLKNVNLFAQPHQQIRVQFLLACRW